MLDLFRKAVESPALEMAEHDSVLMRELDQVTSRDPFQLQLFIILCHFIAGPYLNHNLSYPMLELE